MDDIATAVEEFSYVITNFEVGAADFGVDTYIDDFQEIEESFRIRKSKSLLERAYKEQHYNESNNEQFSSISFIQSARMLEREKIIRECQELALRRMAEHIPIISPGDNLEAQSKIKSLAAELIKENSLDAVKRKEEVFENLLLKEKALLKNVQQFQSSLKALREKVVHKAKEETISIESAVITARKRLERINFMRTLTLALIGCNNADMIQDHDLAEIVLNKCKPMELQDLNR